MTHPEFPSISTLSRESSAQTLKARVVNLERKSRHAMTPRVAPKVGKAAHKAKDMMIMMMIKDMVCPYPTMKKTSALNHAE